MLRRPAALLACFIALLPLVAVVSRVHQRPSATEIAGIKLKTRGPEDVSISSSDAPKDRLLGGLLASGFDEGSCQSRYQSVLYRKKSPHIPSSYLLRRLRKYEDVHKRCGPNTALYNISIGPLKSGHSTGPMECNYIVLISYSGLGNRILTLASAFLYALLSNRVLLVYGATDMGDLFCEPFPESSWLLPSKSPIKHLDRLRKSSRESYGNMVKNKVFSNKGDSGSRRPLPAYIYHHLSHDYGDFDKLFFCEEDQLFFEKIPWLVMRTNNYFVPSLFLIPKYEEELSRLFPEKDRVFHHLGRYLFHPSNSVWGLITRYYQAHLAKVDERIGIQIRVFGAITSPPQYVLDQIVACVLTEKLLPDINPQATIISTTNARSKAVIMTSLYSEYSDKIRNMYWEHPSASGEIISVYQPSHEEHQQSKKQMHNMKAWAEMYLLSLTDKLVTSSWSTFGYVAQGLGGLVPWIMLKPENQTAPDPACRRAMSMEPCFHAAPFYDCKANRGTDTGALVPHVRHCEDMSWGLKVVNQVEW